MNAEPELVRKLRDAITDEVIKCMGLRRARWPAKVVARIVRPACGRFAELFAAFDRDTRSLGIAKAARRFLSYMVQDCLQFGAESVPTSGPLLVAANHPGATDSVAIVASLPRDDVRIVITDVPFTRSLPAGRDHLIYTPRSRDADGRVDAVRQMIRHLRDGEAVLIFPSGRLDPDPAFLPGAAEAFAGWSRSVALVLRCVPQAQLLTAIVGGVLEPRFMSHPLTRVWPQGWERQRLAEVLQLIQQMAFRVKFALTPRVTFGSPVTLSTLREWSVSGDLVQAIADHARQVLDLHLASKGRAVRVPLPAEGG